METDNETTSLTSAYEDAVRLYNDPNRSDFLKDLQVRAGLWDGNPATPVKRRELPPRKWVPNDDWRALEGILNDRPDHDTTEMKNRNRAEEEEHNARKFGNVPD